MKTSLYAICALAIVLGGNGCSTGTGGRGSLVAAQYVNPQNFTNFRVQGRTPQSTATVFSQEITTSLEPVMRRQFPGDTLSLRFTDIDLGGPRPAGRPGSVRVLRPSNAARLSFDYILQDRAGRKVASGTQRLVDSLQRTLARYPSNSRPLYFEGQILRNWLRSLSVTR
jgi:hypothetical protein